MQDGQSIGGKGFEPKGEVTKFEQYAFTESLKDPDTGREIQLEFNLYVDADDRPLGFAMRRAKGFRAG